MRVPLVLDVPDTLAGVAVLWTGETGEYSASWREREDGVPMERATIARALRELADAIEAAAR